MENVYNFSMQNRVMSIRWSKDEEKIINDFKEKYKFPNSNQLGHKSLVALINAKNKELTDLHILFSEIYEFFKKELSDYLGSQTILDNFVINFIPQQWEKWAIRYDPKSKRVTKYSHPFVPNTKVGRPKIKRKRGKPKL